MRLTTLQRLLLYEILAAAQLHEEREGGGRLPDLRALTAVLVRMLARETGIPAWHIAAEYAEMLRRRREEAEPDV